MYSSSSLLVFLNNIYKLLNIHIIELGNNQTRSDSRNRNNICLQIVVTNTVPHEIQKMQCHKIKTVDISIMLMEAIRRIQNNESMSYLFRNIGMDDWSQTTLSRANPSHQIGTWCVWEEWMKMSWYHGTYTVF